MPWRAVSRSSSSCSRRSPGTTAARLSTWSITPVSVWPTSSWSSRAIRRRSASCIVSARCALSRRSDSRRSNMSLKVRASAATSGSPSTRARVPGESGSWRRIVSASSSSGRNAGRRSSRLSASITSRPTASTSSSVACGGTETVTGAKTSPRKASTTTAALVANTRQYSGSKETRASTGQPWHAGCRSGR